MIMKIGKSEAVQLLRSSYLSLVLLFFITSCENSSVSKRVDDSFSSKDSTSNEKIQPNENSDDFDQFLLEFNTDCDFQKKHIKFPLQSIANLDWEINDYDTSFISRNEYECIELTSPKSNIMQGLSTLKITKTSKNQVTITFGIDDTGLHIEYSFQKKESNWQLIKVVDEST